MFNEILELIRTWPVIAQVFISMVIATVITLISIAFIGYVGDFFNNALPIIIRGYPPERKEDKEDVEE
jgi:hypothetical protein